jgi:hypothetical protein
MTERNAMDANEKYVRETWEKSAGFRIDGPSTGMIEVACGRFIFNSGQFGNMEDFWKGAAEFTRERLEQIRQVEEEIALVTHEYKRATVCGVSMGGATGKALVWQRVIAREQAALAELRRGMKGSE